LRQLNSNQAVAPLIEHLYDSNIQVRRAVIDALKRLKDTRAVEPLLALTDDKLVKMHAVSALSWFDDPRVADFFLELLQNQDQKLQLEAVKYFSRHSDRRTVRLLIPLLKSSYKVMPSWAAGALGNSGDKRAVEPLIGLLTMKLPKGDKEKNQIYRYKRSALLALAKFDDKRLYPLLVDALTDDRLKQDAILALGHLQDKRAVPVLLKHLSDSSPHIRSLAIRSLGEIGDSTLFDTIESFLSDPYEPIAKSAFHTIFRLDPKRSQEILMGMVDTKDPVAFERNLRLIGCSEAKHIILKLVKLAAARKGFQDAIGKQLSQCKNPEITDMLTSSLKKENELDIRIALIDILGKFDDPKIKELLTQYSNDPNPIIRQHVKTELKEFKDVLIVTLNDDEASLGVRYRKGRIKGKNNYTVMPLSWPTAERISGGGQRRRVISGNMGFPIDPRIKKIIENYKFDGSMCVYLEIENPVKNEKLIPRLKDTDSANRQEAVEYLGYFGNTAASPEIIPLLKDRDLSVRLAAARALGLMKSRFAFSHLVDILYDSDVNVTAMAIWALGEINDEKAVIPLGTLMKKRQDLRIIENCVTALAKIDHKAARDVLTTSLLKSRDYRIRLLAADVIGRLGDIKLTPFLQSMLQDPNEYVRQAVARWIGDLSGKEAVPFLTNYLNDYDFYVRKTSIEAIGRIGDLRSVDPLTMLLIDEDKKIQEKTTAVLHEYAQNDDAKHIMGDIFFESINPDDYKGLRKSEKLLRIIGKEYAIAWLAGPAGDDSKTILNYFDLLPLIYRSDDLSELGRKALTEFKNRKLVVNTLTSYALNQSNEDVKIREAIYFLERLKDVNAAPLFVHILENASTFNLGEKRSACRFLGDIRFEKATPLLRRMLSDNKENYTVRMDAAGSLGRIGDKRAVELLIRTMMSSGENIELRQTAIYALGTMREKRAVKHLITFFEDDGADIWLRISSASALGRIGDGRAIGPLVEATKNSSGYLKNAAQMALRKLQKRQ
jgi:HEAT repeat protein